MISPLLANVFLHDVLDQWINAWRKRHAKGEVIIVRYADDFVIGFREESDAKALPRGIEGTVHPVRVGTASREIPLVRIRTLRTRTPRKTW